MSEQANQLTADDGHRVEPGLGLALLTVFVMILVTAVLAGLIYVLMIAISPIEQRTPKSRPADVPAAAQQAPAAPAVPPPAPGIPTPAQ